jgi:pyruvate-formate lyase
VTERVRKLREESLRAVPYLTPERALLVTEAYEQLGCISAPVRRALVFKHIMEKRMICIHDGELIVGERGPAPKATYTYPELCCHSLEDLEILDTRAKVSFKVDEEMRNVYRDRLIPFWRGKTVREKIFGEMTQEWKDAYDAGVFTEFMEQRAPGHTVLDNKIYRKGMLEFKRQIEEQLAALDFLTDPEAFARREELRAMAMCADAIVMLAIRHADLAAELAGEEPDPMRRSELEHIEHICRRVPAHAPTDFQEALQAYWFVHLGVITELNPWDAYNPGRLDQHLQP